MSLKYCNQPFNTIINAQTLTATHSTAETTVSIPVSGFVQGVFDIDYTRGSGETSAKLEVRIRVSRNGTDWYQIVNEAVSGGTSDLTPRVFSITSGATPVKVSLPIDLMYKWVEVSLKETGVTTNYGTASVHYTLSGE